MSALISHAQQTAVSVGHQLQRTAGNVGLQLQTTTNRLVPPKQREQKLKELHAFSNRNPKLATFLATQIALLGVPLLLFIAFAISTLIISLATCLLLAITTAFIFTLFAVGICLFFLIPTLFIASFAATCFFLWGLVVYLVLRRFNEGEAPVKRGTRVGDKVHGLTGGRLGWMVDEKDGKSMDMGKRQVVSYPRGDEDYHVGGNTSGQGSDGYVSGNEWEKKWAKGVRQRQNKSPKALDVKVDELTLYPSP